MDRYDEMKKYLNIIREQLSDNRINVPKDIEDKIEDDRETKYRKQEYIVIGYSLILNGKNNRNVKLTSLEKNAFIESVKEFQEGVTEMVDFNKLNVYPDNVEWSGKLTEYNINFVFTIGEQFGVYVYMDTQNNNLNFFKIDDDSYNFLGSLKNYYGKFKAKWEEVLAARKQM